MPNATWQIGHRAGYVRIIRRCSKVVLRRDVFFNDRSSWPQVGALEFLVCRDLVPPHQTASECCVFRSARATLPQVHAQICTQARHLRYPSSEIVTLLLGFFYDIFIDSCNITNFISTCS